MNEGGGTLLPRRLRASLPDDLALTRPAVLATAQGVITSPRHSVKRNRQSSVASRRQHYCWLVTFHLRLHNVRSG